jgi:hypothetical protein
MGKTHEVDDFYYTAAGETPPEGTPFSFQKAINGLKLGHREKDGTNVPGNEDTPEIRKKIEEVLETKQMQGLKERVQGGDIIIAHMAVLGAITFFVAEQKSGEIILSQDNTLEQVNKFFSPAEEDNNEQTPDLQ